jgi:hypothetical protein
MPVTPDVNPEVISPAETETDYLAVAAQKTADFLCDTRPLQGVIIAKEIIDNPDYHSWKLAGKVAVIGALDKVDGSLSRWAAKRLGVETTSNGAEKDQINDKRWAHIMFGALATRAFMNDDYSFGKFMLANQAAVAARDVAVTRKRKEAEVLGVDAKAQKLGKYKTGLQNLTFTIATSPIAKTRLGKKALYALQTAGTGLSVGSGISLIRSLDEGIAEAELAKDFTALKERFTT